MAENQLASFSIDIPSSPLTGESYLLDDDGRPKRTGSFWTASAHIITAVIGSGGLTVAWAMAQLGWVAGPVVMLLFSTIHYFMSTLLAACYRSGDPVNGKRNYSYMDAVYNNLGGAKVKLCGVVQYGNLFGVAVGYTIASAVSLRAIKKSNCFHDSEGKNPCRGNINMYVIAFGVVQIFISQIPDFNKLPWLSIVAAAMSCFYSSVCLILGIAKVKANGNIKGSLTGISIGGGGGIQKIWLSMEALGEIAFAYSCSRVFIEIQDTVKSPPSEEKTMKKASLVSVGVTTLCFMLYGSVGYAAFGDMCPNNLLTGFGFYNPYWLLDIANATVVVRLVLDYQLSCRPIFTFIENQALIWFPATDFMARDIRIRIPGLKPKSFNIFRLISRTVFVVLTTVFSVLFPFFHDLIGLFGAIGFWPLTVYFPMEMYIIQKKIPKWSKRWFCLQFFSLSCLVVTIAAAAGSVAGVVYDFKPYKLFAIDY